ncbi:Fpg/Nei family DNA glycosylase [Streptomyces sp. NPDC048434]|uniref:Fpg/Nei family DNA glycosylase n=1 Tax=Streptomyces sp. NPDC048434 TaxID=3365549 RepID=UPI00371AC87F
MPELPDVEAFRGILASCAQGRRISHVDVCDASVLHGVSAARLRRDLTGRTFTGPQRHGKWLLAATDGEPILMMHFGMTGELACCHPDDEVGPYDRVLFTVGRDRQLRFRDQRKLQGLWLEDDSGAARILDRQGPDAMEVDRSGFDEALSGRRGVKSALLDQSVLAGLGNLLADEILWRARIQPARRAADLTQAERGRLYRDMRRTVRSAVEAGRVPGRKSWLTGHRDAKDAVCPRCREQLRRGRIAGRGTVWCPHCQPDS